MSCVFQNMGRASKNSLLVFQHPLYRTLNGSHTWREYFTKPRVGVHTPGHHSYRAHEHWNVEQARMLHRSLWDSSSFVERNPKLEKAKSANIYTLSISGIYVSISEFLRRDSVNCGGAERTYRNPVGNWNKWVFFVNNLMGWLTSKSKVPPKENNLPTEKRYEAIPFGNTKGFAVFCTDYSTNELRLWHKWLSACESVKFHQKSLNNSFYGSDFIKMTLLSITSEQLYWDIQSQIGAKEYSPWNIYSELSFPPSIPSWDLLCSWR